MNAKKIQRKRTLLQKRKWRIRNKVSGTPERPRLCLHFSNKHISAQLIDDVAGTTVLGLSTQSKDVASEKLTANQTSAATFGKLFSEKAKGKGVERVVFDRNGRRFHGAVKAFADSARESGLQF